LWEVSHKIELFDENLPYMFIAEWDYLALPFWRWAVLVLGCFDSSVDLLDYYYASLPLELFFHLSRLFFKKATVFF